MITWASSRIAEWLLRAGAISENDRELYEYAAYSFLFSLVPLLLAALLGCAAGMAAEGILMILPFLLIRKFSGGFHLKSPGLCLFFSSLLLSAFLFGVRLIAAKGCFVLFPCLVAAAAVQLFLCSPIDSEARTLSPKERAVFKRIARGMSAAFLAVYLVLLLFCPPRVSAPVGAGVVLAALLQLPCLFAGKCSPD